MSEWQPIETAPKDDTPVLVWDGEHVLVAEPIDTGDGWWWRATNGVDWLLGGDEWPFDVKPTHWMPLPEMPK